MTNFSQKAKEALSVGQVAKAQRILLKMKFLSVEEKKMLVQTYCLGNKHKQAIELANTIKDFENNKFDLELILLVSNAYCCEGKFDDAIFILEKSLQINLSITNSESVLALCQLYARQFDLVKVEKLAPKLLKWQDYYLRGAMILVKNASELGCRKLLVERIKCLLPYYQSFSEVFFTEIVIYSIRAGLLKEAQELIGLFETRNARNYSGLQSIVYLELKKYKIVVKTLSEEITNMLPASFYTKGVALDRLGKFDLAFECFQKGAVFRKSEIRVNCVNDDLKKFHKLLKNSSFIEKSKQQQSYKCKYPMAFIFGFPRSGTTLLDNVLDTQNALHVMSERPALYFVKQAVVNSLGLRYPEELHKLTPANLSYLRALYFKNVEKIGGKLDPNDIHINKGPFHTIDLAFIQLLFPEAKLVLSLRHPIDVCISCFQQDFSLNTNSNKLITLDDIIKRYVGVFSLLEEYESKLHLDILKVKYEDLVAGFLPQMKRVFSFLEYEPVDNYINFFEHAAEKYVQSSSRGQTDKPLYSASIFRWRNYRQYVEQYVPELDYFVNKFGYDVG